MPKTRLTLRIPGQDDVILSLEPGDAIEIEANPEEESQDDDRSAPSGWTRVRGYDALPGHVRDALRDLGPMRRAGFALPPRRELPAGFSRLSEDSFVFVLSEPVVGRDGFVLAGPWDLSEYALNPVVLYQHNAAAWDAPATSPDDLLPVGRALQVAEPSEGLLISEVIFDAESERGAKLARLYRSGFLSAVSARWWPQEIVQANKLPADNAYRSEDPDVYVMFGNRLIEQSAVVIPGLASATLIEGPKGSGRSIPGGMEPPPTPTPEPAAAEAPPAPEPRGLWGFPKE
jgi:hypothetical protein